MVMPGKALAARPLHFIWIVDCSGSMEFGGKIQSLNEAIREAVPHMREVADENPNAEVLVRVLKFSDGASWHTAHPVKIEDFVWTDLEADGVTDMGKAMSVLANEMKMPPMPERALPPVLVLLSDGQPTDSFQNGLKELMEQKWGEKAVRLAIAIGKDADHDVLKQFIGNPEIRVLEANNPKALVNYIKWVSTAVLKAASNPNAGETGAGGAGLQVPVQIVTVPADIDPSDDVW